MSQEHCVAIVRRKGHLNRALAIGRPGGLHFVCMSIETFEHCRKYDLPASIPFDYESVRGRDFTTEGRKLATQWVEEVAVGLELCPDERMYLATRFTLFFAMALFSQELIKAVIARNRPDKVLLWRDSEQPILSDWAPGSEEGAIFSQIAAASLEAENIPVEFLERFSNQSFSAQHESAFLQKFNFCRDYIPKPIRTVLRSIYLAGLNVPRRAERMNLRRRVAWLHLKRRLFGQPMILFWGAHSDAVYQWELASHWKKEFGWSVMRAESYDVNDRRARARTREGNAPDGFNQQTILHTFSKEERNGLFSKPFFPPFSADKTCHGWIGANAVKYQYRAMFQLAVSLKSALELVSGVLRKLRPDCVITHLDAKISIAARRVNIPSVVIAHAGHFIPHYVSMQGDFNVVAGKVQKEFCEDLSQCSGKLESLGWPHLNILTRQPPGPLAGSSEPAMPTVVFLACDSLDFNFWDIVDYRAYHQLCQTLKELAFAEQFKLIVKLHPRYGDMPFHRELFNPDGQRIVVEMRPNLAEILQRSRLVIASGLTTAIFESLGYQVPTIFAFFHYPPEAMGTPYHRALRKGTIFSANEEELKKDVVKLLRSSAERRLVIGAQNEIFSEILQASGKAVSRQIAHVCQTMIGKPFLRTGPLASEFPTQSLDSSCRFKSEDSNRRDSQDNSNLN